MSGDESPSSMMEWEADEEKVTPLKQSNKLEEGELTDSEPDDDKRSRSRTQKFLFDNKGKDAIDHSIFNDDDLIAMEKRANRYGLDIESDASTLDKELKQLYQSLNITTEDDVRHARFDTIHVRGTKDMNTNDVFEYFFTHKPLFLEWIDENSCNVVWKDDISAAQAMIFYSRAIKIDSECEDMDSSTDEAFTNNIWSDAIKSADISVPIPNGRWRAGAPHPKSEYIFLRFANKSDKKINVSEKLISKKYDMSDEFEIGKISSTLKSKIQSVNNVGDFEEEKSKNPWGDLCRSWGINDTQEVFIEKNTIAPHRLMPIVDPNRKSVKDRIGIPLDERLPISRIKSKSSDITMRLGKRTHQEYNDDESDEENGGTSDEEWKVKSKVPRMRMHADDEEKKISKVKEPVRRSSFNSITVEVKNEASSDYELESSDAQEDVRSSHRTKHASKEKSNIYSRLGNRKISTSNSDSDEHENSVKGRLSTIQKVKSNNTKTTTVSTVWSRLDFTKNKNNDTESEDDLDDENQEDLRKTLSKNVKSSKSSSQDLRERIRKKQSHQRSPLRIEVENELYSDRI